MEMLLSGLSLSPIVGNAAFFSILDIPFSLGLDYTTLCTMLSFMGMDFLTFYFSLLNYSPFYKCSKFLFS